MVPADTVGLEYGSSDMEAVSEYGQQLSVLKSKDQVTSKEINHICPQLIPEFDDTDG